MELDRGTVKQDSLAANLVNKICRQNSCGTSLQSIFLQPNDSIEEVWKEFVKNNLDPDSPCLVYFVDSPTEKDIMVKVVCKKSC
ncbi:hypothetical protein [Desulforamulus ruminis]|uniref:Uncharacterized protein n=1 Tax=Desulforamulus ruminis (strain ATCC 23193 / DSM 2154 / NCIMB 8452 / DL) TaxID=696281 RepID=F6DKI2_DESRL|nr:hypothetical protein [Desulforamulus ruminis]AEG59242.1 hypothetical protein Desru_0966 [Desulforamulus ruminis DSM 2154]